MEAVSMVHPARFLSSIFLAVFLMSAGCFSDQHVREVVEIPHTWANVGDLKLLQQQGVLYYDGVPYSGYTYDRFQNGDTSRLTPYYHGKEEGWMKAWYPNRQLNELRFFSNGKKEGIHKGWWDSGKPKFEYHFDNDEHEGELKEWYANGAPARFFHYSNGHEEGSQKMWWENGDVRANYAVIAGDRFGLTGQKLCSNSSKSQQ